MPYFKVSNTSYRYVPVFWSSDGNNNTGVMGEQTFLEPNNQPPAGYVWFWQNGNTFAAGNTATGNILYIKMSLETYNGINIAPFIQGVEFVTFQFNTPIDVNGNILLGRGETFYIESVCNPTIRFITKCTKCRCSLSFYSSRSFIYNGFIQ